MWFSVQIIYCKYMVLLKITSAHAQSVKNKLSPGHKTSLLVKGKYR